MHANIPVGAQHKHRRNNINYANKIGIYIHCLLMNKLMAFHSYFPLHLLHLGMPAILGIFIDAHTMLCVCANEINNSYKLKAR